MKFLVVILASVVVAAVLSSLFGAMAHNAAATAFKIPGVGWGVSQSQCVFGGCFVALAYILGSRK